MRRIGLVPLFAGAALAIGPIVLASSAQAPAPVQDLNHPQGTNAGIFAFTGNCATCHDTGRNGAPDRYALNSRTPEEVLPRYRRARTRSMRGR